MFFILKTWNTGFDKWPETEPTVVAYGVLLFFYQQDSVSTLENKLTFASSELCKRLPFVLIAL